jgi:microcompartment protein CcmK/EutM
LERWSRRAGSAAGEQQAAGRAADRSPRQGRGNYLVAVDTVDAGVGNGAHRQRQLGADGVGHEGLSIDAAVVGIIDAIDINE